MDLCRKISVLGALILGMFLCGSGIVLGQDDAGPPPGPQYPVADQDSGPSSDISFQTFYDSLANQGTWIQSSDYGYIWQPNVTDPQWAPYTQGHWVYSDDGWTWVSDEPWGWATYHYGRWVNIDGTGWCWVPGYTWAPAWVSWRYGDSYVGWAPLPPDSLVGVDYSDNGTDIDDGFHIGGDCDSYYGIGPGWYNFLPIVYFGDPDYRGYYANRYNNYRLIHRTTNVTNLNVNRNTGGSGSFAGVTLGGPSLLQVDAQSQQPIQRVNLAFTDRVGGGAVNGRTLDIFAPRVNAFQAAQNRPGGSVRSLGAANINRGGDISHPLRINSNIAAVHATPLQIKEAQGAQTNTRVSTGYMPMNDVERSHPTTQLTTMRPMNYFMENRAVNSAGGNPNTYSRSYSTGGGYSRSYSPGGGYRTASPSYRAAPGASQGNNGGQSGNKGR